MDKECTIGFSFVTGKGLTDNIQVVAGVNRDFPESVWEQIKDYPVVKTMLSLGALRIEEEKETTTETAAEAPKADTISDLPINQAMSLVEDSFDVEQLRRWDAKEERIRVKNAIAKRIQAITEGKG